VQKIFNGIPFKYSYSGLAQIEERDGITNNITGKTVFTNFLTPVLNEKNNNSYYYHQNELNSVEAISNSSGNFTERYQYDVYGKPAIYDGSNNIIPSSLAGNRFAYTGQEYDSANGNYRFHFRNYTASTGTFNQRDLIGYADGMGMYQYVHNNPANGIDVFGLNDCPPEETSTTQSSTTQAVEELETLGSNYNTTLTILNMLHIDITLAQEAKLGIDALVEAGEFEKAGAAAVEANKIFDNVKMLKGLGSGLGKLGFGLTALDALIKGNKFGNAINDYNSGKIDGYQLTKSGGNLASSLLSFSGIGSVYGLLDFAQERLISGRSMNDNAELGGKVWGDNSVDQNMDEELMEFHRKNGTIKQFLKFYHKTNRRELLKNPNPNCPQNGGPGGTQKPNPNGNGPGTNKPVKAIGPKDPNEIIGPDGQPTKHWVSVKDKLPYTILYENDKTASAPAKFVRVTSPIEPKQDAATFQLGNFGFNNQTFAVPSNTAAYYQRLDCRDSLGLYVDITAGYDQLNNVAFWEFQSIDPITLLPPSDPLKGFLLLQDSTQILYGHGFVNFSIKPIQTAITLDTIGARASIVFDSNDTIPTNIAKNTIDAFAPTSHMNALAANTNNPVALSWGGVDDAGGCGLKFYTLYVSTDGINFNIIRSGITRTDTSFTGAAGTTYYFFVLATDSVGNTETLRLGEIKSTYIGTGALPITWLYFNGATVNKDNLLDWATASEQNNKQFDVERSLNGSSFSRIGVVNAVGNSSTTSKYQYTDFNIDKLNSPVMYYRLKQIDVNGIYRYSNTIRLNYNTNVIANSIVYPNPTQGLVTITVGDKALVGSTAVLYDVNGLQLELIKITANSQTINMGKYVNGTYFIKLNNKEVLKIVKL
jgi:RHS repeat-associated protein